VKGFIACLDQQKQEFTDEEIKIGREICERVVKAIGRIEKNLSEKDSYIEIIKSTVDLFEARNNFNKDHSKNVSRLAGRISTALNIPPEEQNEIRIAAYLHDI